MASCPVGKEWDVAVKEFGKFNAAVYFHNHNGIMGTLDEVRTYLTNIGKIVTQGSFDFTEENRNIIQEPGEDFINTVEKEHQWKTLTKKDKYNDFTQKNHSKSYQLLSEAENDRARYSNLTSTEPVEYTKGYWRVIYDNPVFGQTPWISFFRQSGTLYEFTPAPEHSKPDTAISSNTYSVNAIINMMNEFADKLGIEYEIVDYKDVQHLPNMDATVKGFYMNGKVYFIKENLSAIVTLHEFSHPLVRALVKTNPELFQKLYQKIAESQEGHEIIAYVIKNYPKLTKDSTEFMEEVMVHALSREALNMKNKIQGSKGFMAGIKEILYHIKQFLRKTFGQNVDVSKLDPETTLEELVNILLKGNKFTMDVELLKKEDLIYYAKEMNDMIEDVMKIEPTERTALTITTFDILVKQIQAIKRNKNYHEMRKILADEFNSGDLQMMKSNLSKYTKKLEDKMTEIEDMLEYEKAHATALVNTLVRLDNMILKITDHLETLTKGDNLDNKDNLLKAYHYNYLLKYWAQLVIDLNKATAEAKIPTSSPLANLIGEIERKIERSKTSTRLINERGLRETLFDQLLPMSQNMEAKYKRIIAEKKAKGATQANIDVWYKEFYGLTEAQHLRFMSYKERMNKNQPLTSDENVDYKRLLEESFTGAQITPEKLEKTMKGELGDANFANSFFEGYMYNADPVVGSFSTYVKNHMTDVLNTAYEKYNTFMLELDPLLKAAGYDPSKTSDMASKLAFIDEVGKYNPDTEQYETRKVLTFLNPYKSYRAAIDELNFKVNEAHKKFVEYGTEIDQKALRDAIMARKKLKRDYFHQEYVQEYYEKDKFLEKDEIGKIASEERARLLEKISQAQNELNPFKDDSSLKLDTLWAEYRQMHSEYDMNGVRKTNTVTDENGITHVTNTLSKVKRLVEYRDHTRKFYNWIERTGAFQNAYQLQEQKVLNTVIDGKKIERDSEEFKSQMADWEKKNARIVLKDSFFERKQEIIKEMSEILSKLEGRLTDAENDEFNDLEALKDKGELNDPKKISRYEELLAKGKNQLDVSLLFKGMMNIAYNYRDDDGQPEGTKMSENTLFQIKRFQERINLAKEKLAKVNGLTGAEQAELNYIYNKIYSLKESLTISETKRLEALVSKKKKKGLPDKQRMRLYQLFAEMEELQYKEATQYYCDAFNAQLEGMDTTELKKLIGRDHITIEDANQLLNPTSEFMLETMMKSSPKFKEWFEGNHIRKKVFFKADGKGYVDEVWERTYAWNVTKPNDEKYYETTEVKTLDGVSKHIKGKAGSKYFVRLVKKEYFTERIIGTTIDNQGQWLPRQGVMDNEAEGITGNRFINQDYFKLKNAPQGSEDYKLFKLLEKVTEYHLKFQKGLSNRSKLFMDVPRYRKNALEAIQTSSATKNIKGAAQHNFPLFDWVIRTFRDLLHRANDDVEMGLNRKEKYDLVRADMFDNELSNIHISGIYNLDHELVSTDILHSMMRYMLSGERQKKLIEINPIAQALKSNLEDAKPLDKTASGAKKVNKMNFLHRGIITWMTKKGQSVRSYAVNNLIEREFDNVLSKGWLSEDKWAHTLSQLIFKRAAFGFFALNIPSALKNMLGAKWQGMLEAVGGQYLNTVSLIKGEAWAMAATTQISFEIYKRTPKGLHTQILDIFDAIQERLKERFGENMSRTLTSDVASLSWLYNFRKWTEMEATIQIFAGMLHFQKVKQNGQNIAYADAWEIKDDKIKLKDGIDIRYSNHATDHTVSMDDTIENIAKMYNIPVDEFRQMWDEKKLSAIHKKMSDINKSRDKDLADIDPTKENEDKIKGINYKYDRKLESAAVIKIENNQFKTIKNRIQQTQNSLQGAYSKFDQPEAQRYLAFRFISFLRRYFTPMLMNRFGFSGNILDPKGRLNPGLSDNPTGYYVTVLRTLIRIMTVDKAYLTTMTQEEQRAWLRTVVEIGALLAITMILFPALGYYPDDPDRYEKLRKRSGPLPLPGVHEDPDYKFNLPGFLENHLLALAMQVRSENEAFVPWPGFGLDDYAAMMQLKSLAAGPTIDTYKDIFVHSLNMLTGDQTAYYKRAVGPYEWQQEGSAKLAAKVFKAIGITGSSVSPVQQLKNLESIRQSSGRR